MSSLIGRHARPQRPSADRLRLSVAALDAVRAARGSPGVGRPDVAEAEARSDTRKTLMEQTPAISAAPLLGNALMSDQPPSNPPTWKEWKDRHKKWAWVLSPEWASEWVVYWSRNWDFVKVLELAGKFALVVTAVTWLWEAGDREKARQDAIKAKHYRAWELINSARGSTGDGGRRDAVQDLNEDNVSLAAAPLAKAFLINVKLKSAILVTADLTEANLAAANLGRANLAAANLTKANLYEANLYEADLREADLTEANLAAADLTEANLYEANLLQANLTHANLGGASLFVANLTKANLLQANLTEAVVGGVKSNAPGQLPYSFPRGWSAPPAGWELYDDKGVARLRRSNAQPSMPPSSPK